MSRNARRPELPKQLLDEISAGESVGKSNSRSLIKRTVAARKAHRKAHRKALREQKKAARSAVRIVNGNIHSKHHDYSESELVEDEDEYEIEPPPPRQTISEPKAEKQLKSILKKPKRYEEEGSPRMSRATREALEEEDTRITRLEKRLGIKKKKKIKNFGFDVLDEILGEDAGFESDSEKEEREEYEKWLATKRKTVEDQDLEEESDEGLDSRDLDEVEEDEGDEVEEEDGDEDKDSSDDAESNADFAGDSKPRENPYKPPISAASAPKYVPPSLRAKSNDDEESLSRLKRQLQGQLNKLSESNLLGILREVEDAFSKNPRQNVISVLIDLLMGLLADRSSHPDSFIILHAGFISAIYKVVGSHFGAQLLERLVNDFSHLYEHQEKSPDGSKETSNLIGLLSELYAFQVINCNLIFDYLKIFLAKLSELNTELILKIVRNSGPQLRKDDPGALKDVVILLQRAVAQKGESLLSVRTKFMIETITDLKNNKSKSNASSEQASKQIVRMRKTLGTLSGRSFQTTEPLGVGLKDIQTADKTGKWWLVGASWKSSVPLLQEQVTEVEDVEMESDMEDPWEEARRQGMNTDIKRSIFVAIQSAVDYKHALIQLRKISLKAKQQLEIPGVLLHLAGATEAYNPFYRVIAQHLCTEHKYRKAFQFNLWTIFRKLGEKDLLSGKESDFTDFELDNRSIFSLGKFYGELLAARVLPITILKTVDFLHLQKKTLDFLEVLLVTLFLSVKKSEENHEAIVAEIFSKAREEPRDMVGLQLIISGRIPSSKLLDPDLIKEKKKRQVLMLAKVASDSLRKLALRIGV